MRCIESWSGVVFGKCWGVIRHMYQCHTFRLFAVPTSNLTWSWCQWLLRMHWLLNENHETLRRESIIFMHYSTISNILFFVLILHKEFFRIIVGRRKWASVFWNSFNVRLQLIPAAAVSKLGLIVRDLIRIICVTIQLFKKDTHSYWCN